MARGITMFMLPAVAVALSGTSNAHSPYLLPNVFDVVDRKHVTVEGSFTETFFVPDVAMKADDYHVIAPDGSKGPLTPVYMQDLAVLEVPTTAQGTYRISTGIREGRTSKAAFSNGQWKFLEPGDEAPSGARVYDVKSVTRADVYVTRGLPTQPALAPRNAGLEFRPLTHPNSVFAGSDAKFEVLFDGKPLADQLVSVHFGDERYSKKKLYTEIRTDAAGRFTVHPTAAGLYLAMTRLRVLPTGEGRPATSHTYSVTFEATD